MDDTCGFQFPLWDAGTNGNQIGPTLFFDGEGGHPWPITVDNGLFNIEYAG